MSNRKQTQKPAVVAINPSDFNIDLLRVSPPSEQKWGTMTQITQTIEYDGRDLYVKLPKQSTFGFSYSAGVDDNTPTNGERREVSAREAKKIQVTYPAGETPNLTPEEQAVQDMFTQIRQKILESLVEEVQKHPMDEEGNTQSVMGKTQFSVISGAAESGKATPQRVNFYIKDPFQSVKDKDKKVDLTKPKRAYLTVLSKTPKIKGADGKLVPTGEGCLVEAKIRVYEPDGVSWRMVENVILPDDINGSKQGYGFITPVVQITGVYIGAHGQNPHVASVQMKVVNARYDKRASGRAARDFFEDDEGEGITIAPVREEAQGDDFEDLTAAKPAVEPKPKAPRIATKGKAPIRPKKIVPRVAKPSVEESEE